MNSKELAQACIQFIDQTEKPKEALSAFLSFLEENNLLYQLPSIVRYLEQIQNTERKQNTLTIESPFEISEQLISKIKTFVGADKAGFVETNINAKLLGGFRTTFQGFVTDASVRNNLQALKKQLTK